MNPSILFPQHIGETWKIHPWPKDVQATIVVCVCQTKKLEGKPIGFQTNFQGLQFGQSSMINYNKNTESGPEKKKLPILMCECPDCGTIHWSCPDLFALISVVESKIILDDKEFGE